MMDHRPFLYRQKRRNAGASLYCEDVSLAYLAKLHGTPLYVYSASHILQRFKMFDQAFAGIPHTVCYAVKANSNLSILRILANAGAGFDVVSGGELERVRRMSGQAARKVVFSGVGKTADELDLALESDILLFNVESEGEFELLLTRAEKLQRLARVALRVNPDIPTETHPYMSTGSKEHKFGVGVKLAHRLYMSAQKSKYLDPAGVSVHIGSQINDMEPFRAAASRIALLVQQLRLRGIALRYVDAGGGLGISYTLNSSFAPQKQVSSYAATLRSALNGLRIHLILEPGRFLVGNAGGLLTRVLYVKRNRTKTFVVVDAAMNDLLRPALLDAYHEILPVRQPGPGQKRKTVDVVGPVCETGDFLARDRMLAVVEPEELLTILDAGAYGRSVSSNYNSRLRAAEVLVRGNRAHTIRTRETFADLIRQEI